MMEEKGLTYQDDAEDPRETVVRSLKRRFDLDISHDELSWVHTSRRVEQGVMHAV